MKIVISDGELMIDPSETPINTALFNHCILSIGEYTEPNTLFGIRAAIKIADTVTKRRLLEEMMIIHGYGLPIIYQVENDENSNY